VLSFISKTIKLDKITGFLNSVFKWSIGIVFTLFSGFLTIQGISAGKFDGVSIKATKFAMKSYIPIIGSYILRLYSFFENIVC
jgi:stage III sporulation protein AE